MMEKAIRDGSLGGGTSKEGAESVAQQRREARLAAEDIKMKKATQKLMEENTKVLGNFNKSLGKFTDDMGIKSKILSKAFEDAIESLNYDQLEVVPQALQEQLRRSPIFSKANISNLEGAFKFFEEMADKKELIESGAGLDYLMNGATASAESLEALEAFAKKYNTTVKDAALHTKNYTKEVKEAHKVREDLTIAMRRANFTDQREKAKSLAASFAELKKVVTAFADALTQTMQPAYKFGTNIGDSLTAFMSGMKPAEFAQNVATYRQSIRAAGMSIDDFREITEDGAMGLTAYTGSLQDSIKLQSTAFEAAKRMGLQDAASMRNFMNQQVETFKKLNTVFSVTAEQFMAMNKHLKNSAEVNSYLYRLNQKQRAQAFLQIQQTVATLRTMGLMQEQALKVVDAMAALATKSPKERLKQAARLQALGGALGFGPEATQAASMIRTGKTQTPEFAEAMKTMQVQMGQFMGQGLPQEMMAMQMLQTTGLQDLLGPKSAFSDLNKEQFQSTQNIESLAEKRNELGGQMLGWIQRIEGLMSGPIMKLFSGLTTGLGALTAAMIGGSVAKQLFGSLLGGIGAKVGGSVLMKTILKRALMVLGPIGIIGSLAWSAVDVAMAAQAKREEKKGQTQASKMLEKEKAAYVRDAVINSGAAIEQAKARLGGVKGLDLSPQEYMSGPGWTHGRRKTVAIAGETMTKRELGEMKLKDRSALELQHAIQNIKDKQAAEDYAKEKYNADQMKQYEENKKLMEKELATLEHILLKIQDPDKAVVKQLQENDAKQEVRDKEALDANKKNVRIMWAREAPAG